MPLSSEDIMNTIYTFLENMFSTLPKTEMILKAKEDLYQMMIEKYEDYKKEGKTENEAVGLVISEFGNIDELLTELGIEVEKTDSLTISSVEADDMLKTYKKHSKRIAMGVLIIIFAVSLGISIEYITSFLNIPDQEGLSRIIVIVLGVIPSVGLFISSGLEMSNYNHLFEGDYDLASDVKHRIEHEANQYKPLYNQNILINVLLIISSILFFVSSAYVEDYDTLLVSLGLLTIGYGVYKLILKGVVMLSYNKLLKRGDYRPSVRKAEKTTEIIASVIFPLAAAVYLLISFLTGRWDLTWIIWPVVGVTFGAISSGIEEYHKSKKIK